jgi:hypothetical protein
MSIQDVNWGYREDAAEAPNPYPEAELVKELAKRGYVGVGSPGMHEIRQYKKAGSLNPVTWEAPNLKHKDFPEELVYDRNIVIDKLLQLDNGSSPDGGDNPKVKAKKK